MAFNWDNIKAGNPEMNDSEKFFSLPDSPVGVGIISAKLKTSHFEMTQRFDQLKLDSNINDDNQENIPLIENIIPSKKIIHKITENSKPTRKINNPSTHLYTGAENIKKKLELLRVKLVEEEKRKRVFHSKPAPKFISKPQTLRVKEETTKRKNPETPDVLKPIAERRKKIEVKKPIFDPKAQIITRFTKSSDFINTETKKTCLSRETINAIPTMAKTAAPKLTKPAILPRVSKTSELRSSIKSAMVPIVSNKVDIPKSKLSKDPVEPKVSKPVRAIRSVSAPIIVAPKSRISTGSKNLNTNKTKPFVFTANPYKPPKFVADKPVKPNLPKKIRVAPFNLQLSERVAQRKQFDVKYRKEMELKKIENENKLRVAESLAVRELRKKMSFRANPNPFK